MSVTLLCVGCREKSSEPSAANNDEQAIKAAMQEYHKLLIRKIAKNLALYGLKMLPTITL